MSELKNQLAGIFSGIFAAIDAENADAAEPLLALEPIQRGLEELRINRPDRFYMTTIYPMSRAVDGLIATVVQGHQAQFLAKHSEFVEGYFKKLIEKYEGSPCCADKSRTVVRYIMRSLRTGELIKFDYNQEYTYHLPKKVFTSHDEIMALFDALHRLYYANPEPFIEQMAALKARLGE